ncbi:hypothetical protein V3C99_001343 [Haemonchus contortus]
MSSLTTHAKFGSLNWPIWPIKDKKADLHPKKVLLSCWWSRKGMEHWELLEKGQTINATMYVEQLQKLKAHIDRTRRKNADVYSTMTTPDPTLQRRPRPSWRSRTGW